MVIKTDICVIGAGAGGLSVAAGAVQMGARVVLIEAGDMGGDCLNHGCVPSKALLAAGKAAHHTRVGGPGVAGVAPQVDFAAAQAHVQATIAAIAPHDSQERFESLGCTVIRAHARFTSAREIEAGAHRIRARRFVVATGARPFVPPIPGLKDVPYLTNETLFGLRDCPDHLIVIGAGPIGLEMAQAHRRLGARVTVIDAGTPLSRDDPEMAAVVLDQLRAEGIEILSQTAVQRVSDEQGVTVHTDGRDIHGSHLLLAVGRQAAVEKLGLEAAGVAHDARGITVNDGLRSTTNRRIYAIGDVAGGAQFTHVAGYHAGVVIRSLLFGLRSKARRDHIPSVTYTDPELAQIGLTEPEARARYGARLTVLRQPFSGNDRALAEGRPDGMLKLMVVKSRPVGVSIAGAQAGNLIAPWAVMIANRHKISTLTGAVLPYPTLAEINKRAAGAYYAPKLFESRAVKRVVGLVQKLIP